MVIYLFGLTDIIQLSLIIVFVLIVFVFSIIYFTKRDKKGKIDEKFIDSLIQILGGAFNIKTVTVENARIRFTVAELEKADLEKLKTLSEKGVFVSSNSIKTLFKYDSVKIKVAIEKKIG